MDSLKVINDVNLFFFPKKKNFLQMYVSGSSTVIYASVLGTNFSFFHLSVSFSMIYDKQLIIQSMQQRKRESRKLKP